MCSDMILPLQYVKMPGSARPLEICAGELYIGSMHGQQGDLQRTGVLARFMPDGQIELHGHAGNRVSSSSMPCLVSTSGA